MKEVSLTGRIQLTLFNIGFVFNFADDFFEHVLDGDEACDTTILVNDDRHMVAVLPKFPQQHIESLALGTAITGRINSLMRGTSLSV